MPGLSPHNRSARSESAERMIGTARKYCFRFMRLVFIDAKLFREARTHEEVADLAAVLDAERQEEAARDGDRGEERHEHAHAEHEREALDERRAEPEEDDRR